MYEIGSRQYLSFSTLSRYPRVFLVATLGGDTSFDRYANCDSVFIEVELYCVCVHASPGTHEDRRA